MAGALLVKALSANAQPAKKVPRIGVLHPGAAASSSQNVEAFKQGLRERGYVEGQNIVVERRFGDGGKVERIAEIASELVRMKVDVIVTTTDVAIAAVKQQTQTIPIVMANSTDPVGTGFVASLARPGGNITGLTSLSPELSGRERRFDSLPADVRSAFHFGTRPQSLPVRFGELLAARTVPTYVCCTSRPVIATRVFSRTNDGTWPGAGVDVIRRSGRCIVHSCHRGVRVSYRPWSRRPAPVFQWA